MNDDFSFSRWAVLFPVLSLAAFVGATIMIFTTPTDAAATANERRALYTMVAFLGLSALIQGNALFQLERRLRNLSDDSEPRDDSEGGRLGDLAAGGVAAVEIQDVEVEGEEDDDAEGEDGSAGGAEHSGADEAGAVDDDNKPDPKSA